jgi:hypothetical protein
VIGQSKETCYVRVEGSKEFNLNLFSQISKSLISQYFKPIKNIPPSGISIDSCVYELTVTKEGDTTFVVFSGEDLNAYGDSKLYGSDGFQQSLLKSLYRSLEHKRKKICEDYGELLKKCGGVVQQDEPKKSVSAPAKISKKVIPVTPKVVKVPKTPTKKSITQTTSTSGGNSDVVIDRTTGLMWQKKPDGVERNWKDAELYCQKLSLGGYSDWRLPNESVLMKMIKNKMMFSSSLRNNYYWSSTVSNPTSWATYVNFGYGDAGMAWKGSGMYVRCVRGGN